jgi:hypothetical protein
MLKFKLYNMHFNIVSRAHLGLSISERERYYNGIIKGKNKIWECIITD